MIQKLKSEAPRKTMALLLALTTALGPTAMPAFAASKPARNLADAIGDGDAHPAPGCDLPGECFLRPLFRNLPGCDQSLRRARVRRFPAHTDA